MKRATFASIAGRAVLATAMATLLFIAAAPAHAARGSSVANNHPRFAKLKLAAATEVSGALLAPGEYEVKVRTSDAGTSLEFSHWTYNPYPQEGLPVWSREVIATVPAQARRMNAAAAQTHLMLASEANGKALALRIGGDDVEYGF